MSYEEDNWAKLSPKFRNAHNRLRQVRGLPTIPPPKIDLYVPPRAPMLRRFDPGNPEFIAAAREFNGGRIPFAGAQGEGFTINGKEVSFPLNDAERAADAVRRKLAKTRAIRGEAEGFKINGRYAR